MPNGNTLHVRAPVVVNYNTIRNITSPEDTQNDRKVMVGQVSIKAILSLPTNENVRDYLLEADGKQRARPTQVHKAIRETLRERSQDFTVLNGGIVIVAKDVEIDEKSKVMTLHKASIINGSQTQGVIRDFIKEYGDSIATDTHIKFELIVTSDDALIAEISIARNFQNDVNIISIVGRRGHLDELETRLQQHKPGLKLRKNETQVSNSIAGSEDGDYVPTEKLLQVICALIPNELWPRSEDKDMPNKVFTYSRKAQCLKEFQDTYTKAHNPEAEGHKEAVKLYEFYLDIAAQALDLYSKWKTHQGFQGSRLRSIEREGTEIVEIPDGIIFPILSALSVFAVRTTNGWKIAPPVKFQESRLIKSAISTYQDIASSNPQTMGKSKACYSALYEITSIYKYLAD